MPLSFSVLNWNVAGAKFLEHEEARKQGFREKVNESLARLIDLHNPYVITLQEIVEYNEPEQNTKNIIDCPDGYVYYPYILIDSKRHAYVSKWRKVVEEGNWPPGSYFGQGNAMLWRKDLAHFQVFGLPKLEVEPSGRPHIEEVLLMSGLYFGDRNTEPRAALVAHFMITNKFAEQRNPAEPLALERPLDVFVVNLHLTTLTREREGIPRIDEEASRIRQAQLEIILHGIVSRYNEWRQRGYPFRDKPPQLAPDQTACRYAPLWILCGDFNFTPESLEYAMLERRNFVDACPNKGAGTKGSAFGDGARATITCDYIFAGPKFMALDPRFIDAEIARNPLPNYAINVSDHYPLFAQIPLSKL